MGKIITIMIPYCVPGTVVSTSLPSIFTRTLCMGEMPGSPHFQMLRELREFNLFQGTLRGNLETDGNDTGKCCLKSSRLLVSILFILLSKSFFQHSHRLKFNM